MHLPVIDIRNQSSNIQFSYQQFNEASSSSGTTTIIAATKGYLLPWSAPAAAAPAATYYTFIGAYNIYIPSNTMYVHLKASSCFKIDLLSLLMTSSITTTRLFLLILNTLLLQLLRTPPDISSVIMVHISCNSREQHWIAGPVVNAGVPQMTTFAFTRPALWTIIYLLN